MRYKHKRLECKSSKIQSFILNKRLKVKNKSIYIIVSLKYFMCTIGVNIREELLTEHSKSQITKIVHYIGNDENKFTELINLFFGDDLLVIQRSAWVLSHVVINYPFLIKPYYEEIIKLLEKDVHDAVKRNIFRLLQFVEIPEKWETKILDICFNTIVNREEAVAIRAFAISVAHRICNIYPELMAELKIILNDNLDMEKPAFVSRVKMVSNNKFPKISKY